MLITTKKVKQLFKEKGVRVSSKTFEVLSKEFEKLCLKTVDNVFSDKLKTARPSHVPKVDILLNSSSITSLSEKE
ncbi:MAG: hypothetical protein GDA46_00230 [Bdellovibrionales bacterium]|nr:hypothetical protein [Bdellovibrionales bacterium]